MNWKQPKVYAVKHKDEATRAASKSGGVFTALSDQVLSNDGVVYGCILTDDFCAVHIRTDNMEQRNKMRGSKYIQSKLEDTFKNIKIDLDMGRSLLFSGTSCQVAGLRKYLGKEYANLFCVDIVCHGVPSKRYGMHIFVGKSRGSTQKSRMWIFEIKGILVGMTMWKHFILKTEKLRAVKCSRTFFMVILFCVKAVMSVPISLLCIRGILQLLIIGELRKQLQS